jgi:hypothetical protein
MGSFVQMSDGRKLEPNSQEEKFRLEMQMCKSLTYGNLTED